MSSKTLFVKLVPQYQRLRNERLYSEAQVKKILRAFARDIGCNWPESRLNEFIESVFDFD
jgi:hypothetical protein